MTIVRTKARASVRKSTPDAPQKSLTENERNAIAPFTVGIAEYNRREQGDFDGLLGQFHESASPLLRDMLTDLRDYLLGHTRSESEARGLLLEHSNRPGYRNVTPVTDDLALVLRLLNGIRNAAKCTPQKFIELTLGVGGARDLKRQAGTRKERKPEITRWINTQLKRNPSAKSTDLWTGAPEWITDQIGQDRFAKRVTASRKRVASK